MAQESSPPDVEATGEPAASETAPATDATPPEPADKELPQARALTRPRRTVRPVEIAIFAGGLAAAAVALIIGTSSSPSASTDVGTPVETKAAGKKAALKAFEMPACEGSTQAATRQVGDPRARESAQRGLTYLAKATAEWQERNNCYGCHVQAVTLEALAVGRRHQYTITSTEMQAVLKGMIELPGGAKQSGGLGHPSPNIALTAKIMGSAALARYDQWVDASLRDYVIAEARAVRDIQETSGSVPMPFSSAPVATGPIQSTAHAIVTWKQAYERTADDQWLTAISRAEDWLRGTVAPWRTAAPDSIQDMNYAIMGLIAAGVSRSEEVMVHLDRTLAGLQNQDGGWALQRGGASEAFATGQALYVLRLMGRDDRDPLVARGTSWLMERQQTDGSWSSAGFGKAEAMWAVLGLVSIDVLSVTVAGIQGGQHVGGTAMLTIDARDNSGAGVTQVELFVDDIRVAGACSASLTYAWDTAGLEDGMHVVEARATNKRGEVSRRFVEVYAGNVYLTQIGTRFAGSGTEIALRNLAADKDETRVMVEIYEGVDKDGRVVAGNKLHSVTETGKQGAMSFQWNGEGGGVNGKRYVARLTLADKSGRKVQTEEVEFVHDTPEAQERNFAALEGQLALPDGDVAQNAMVELVDEKGRVVQRTKSTKAGSFRFKNIEAKRGYKVRVQKQGFRAEAPAAAAQGEASKVDLSLQAE